MFFCRYSALKDVEDSYLHLKCKERVQSFCHSRGIPRVSFMHLYVCLMEIHKLLNREKRSGCQSQLLPRSTLVRLRNSRSSYPPLLTPHFHYPALNSISSHQPLRQVSSDCHHLRQEEVSVPSQRLNLNPSVVHPSYILFYLTADPPPGSGALEGKPLGPEMRTDLGGPDGCPDSS